MTPVAPEPSSFSPEDRPAAEREIDLTGVLDTPKQIYRWSRLLSSTLISLRGRFNGDLDQYLIYMVFALGDLSRRLQARAGTVDQGRPPSTQAGLNALSVSDITEIPRETTRRKLRLLVKSGHLRRDENQLYYLGHQHSPDEILAEFVPLLQKLHRPS